MKIIVVAVSLFAAMCGTVQALDNSGRPVQPNVVMILSDDLGWQDVKCYDVDEPSVYDTPNLDALAKKSVMFWQAYSPAPSCSPSRCAILSGVHPARSQKTHVLGGTPPIARSSRDAMMDPWYSGRMNENTFTLARALAANGYTTGHAGKWHIAINHKAFPQPQDVGFDYTRSTRGAHSGNSMPNRLEGFATKAKRDPYRLDENGFPFHQNNEDALNFIRQSKDKPFFLYYCNWLVHAPMVTRNEALLNKYATRMGVTPALEDDKTMKGQKNPFYGAMVESLDYYVGQVVSYLETTEDPRWPGHRLNENTLLIFTSDNGGSINYTDNTPLDLGKTSAKEGGTRVPLMISGPGITAGVQSHVMVNGLDFYPTIASFTKSKVPADKRLDGCNLMPLLLQDPTDASLVCHADGSVRDTMMWHYPHGRAKESTLISGEYKLIRNYNHASEASPELELFQLDKTENGKTVRGDWEEAKNLAKAMPQKTLRMNNRLSEMLTAMQASYPAYNPHCKTRLPHQKQVPSVVGVKLANGEVHADFQVNGAEVRHAYLIYTKNGGEKYEEWFRAPMKQLDDDTFSAAMPTGTTHYFVNLIDENQFLVSHPSLAKYSRNKSTFTQFALQP